MIRPYISNYAVDVPEEFYITENQLDLFNDNEGPEEMNDYPGEQTLF
jgi:hypothetical protein